MVLMGGRIFVEQGELKSHRADMLAGLMSRMNLLSSTKVDAVGFSKLTLSKSSPGQWFRVLQENRTGIKDTTDVYIVRKSSSQHGTWCERLTFSVFSKLVPDKGNGFTRTEGSELRRTYPCPYSVLAVLRTGVFTGIDIDYRIVPADVVSAGRVVRVERETLALMAETDILEVDTGIAHYKKKMLIKLSIETVVLSALCALLFKLELSQARISAKNKRLYLEKVESSKEIEKLHKENDKITAEFLEYQKALMAIRTGKM